MIDRWEDHRTRRDTTPLTLTQCPECGRWCADPNHDCEHPLNEDGNDV